jgi:transcriptional regulator with XRE-family HTH domain
LDEKSQIGKKIWQEAERQNFTKVAFSKKMGISRQTLDNWIDGTSPTYDEVQKASKILGIQFGQANSFKDQIFEGEYIGMHKRVWTNIENGSINDRKLLLSLAETLKNLTSASGNQ